MPKVDGAYGAGLVYYFCTFGTLIVSVIFQSVAIGIQQWATFDNGNIGLFQYCVKGLDCINIKGSGTPFDNDTVLAAQVFTVMAACGCIGTTIIYLTENVLLEHRPPLVSSIVSILFAFITIIGFALAVEGLVTHSYSNVPSRSAGASVPVAAVGWILAVPAHLFNARICTYTY